MYPSLEDLKVQKLINTQQAVDKNLAVRAALENATSAPGMPPYVVYPRLDDYFGLDLNLVPVEQLAVVSTAKADGQLMPVSGGNSARHEIASIKQGVREVIMCKDRNGKVGLVLRNVNNGVFVVLVTRGSPAAMAGLKFGDQILDINGTCVAGYDTMKVNNHIKACDSKGFKMIIRDRPFERVLVLCKSSTGHVGFQFKKGCIISLVQDSSAARNGLLINQQLIELDGQNLVGLPDKDILALFTRAPQSVSITVMPAYIYNHIISCIGKDYLRKNMDRSVPDV